MKDHVSINCLPTSLPHPIWTRRQDEIDHSQWVWPVLLGLKMKFFFRYHLPGPCLLFFLTSSSPPLGLPWWLSRKDSTCNVGDHGLIPGLGRSPGEGNEWLLMTVSWPEEFHRLYSPWGRKESDTTEWLSVSFSTSEIGRQLPSIILAFWALPRTRLGTILAKLCCPRNEEEVERMWKGGRKFPLPCKMFCGCEISDACPVKTKPSCTLSQSAFL